jgi:hypothetical protein
MRRSKQNARRLARLGLGMVLSLLAVSPGAAMPADAAVDAATGAAGRTLEASPADFGGLSELGTRVGVEHGAKGAGESLLSSLDGAPESSAMRAQARGGQAIAEDLAQAEPGIRPLPAAGTQAARWLGAEGPGLASLMHAPSDSPLGLEAPADAADRADGPMEVTCPAEDLILGTGASFALSDCRLPQLIGEGDAPHYTLFRTGLGSRGQLDIRVESTAFQPEFWLMDAGFRFIGQAWAEAGTAAASSLTLPSGDYFLIVTVVGGDSAASGNFDIISSFTAQPLPLPCERLPLDVTPGNTGVATHVISPVDCRIFDVLPEAAGQAYVMSYSLDLALAGRLNFTASSALPGDLFVIVATPDGRVIRSVLGDEGGGDAEGFASLPSGEFMLVAGVVGAGSGSFSIEAAVEPLAAGACQAVDAQPGVEIAGKLEAGDCSMSQLGVGSWDQSYVDLYRVVVSQELSEWRILLETDGLAPAIRFYDSQFDTATSGIEKPDGVELDILLEQVTPRTFILAIESAGPAAAEGDYRLSFEYEHIDEACSVETLAPAGSADGSLSDSDCYLSAAYGIYLQDQSARLDQYRVTVNQRGRLSARLTSSAVDMAIIVYDAAVSSYVADADANSNDAEAGALVWPGTYVILATSPTRDLGDYRLETSFAAEPGPDCRPEALAFGAAVDGSLVAGSCAFGDIFEGDFYQRYAQPYLVQLPARAWLTVEHGSADFDAYLELYDLASESLINFNSDKIADLVLDAEISQLLPAGDYLVLASTDYSMETGDFTIEASFDPLPADCGVTDLGLEEVRSGNLSEDSCQLLDLPDRNFTAAPLDIYRVQVPQRGVLTLEMRSDDPFDGVDPSILVYDHRWRLRASNDDFIPGFDLDAYLPIGVGPGVYTVIAASSTGLAGDYELETSFEAEEYSFEVPTPTAVPPTPPPGESRSIYLPFLARGHAFGQGG